MSWGTACDVFWDAAWLYWDELGDEGQAVEIYTAYFDGLYLFGKRYLRGCEDFDEPELYAQDWAMDGVPWRSIVEDSPVEFTAADEYDRRNGLGRFWNPKKWSKIVWAREQDLKEIYEAVQ